MCKYTHIFYVVNFSLNKCTIINSVHKWFTLIFLPIFSKDDIFHTTEMYGVHELSSSAAIAWFIYKIILILGLDPGHFACYWMRILCRKHTCKHTQIHIGILICMQLSHKKIQITTKTLWAYLFCALRECTMNVEIFNLCQWI